MDYLIYALLSLLGMLVFLWHVWVLYLATMNLKRVLEAGKLSKPAAVFGWPVKMLGLILNFVVNTVFLTLILLELPKEKFVSKRLNRLVETDMGWRGDLALWFRSNMLDAFDPQGIHR